MNNKKSQLNKKSVIYDFSKIIVTLIVVLGHITRMYTGKSVLIPKYNSYIFEKLTSIIYSFHMPLFMILSGAVYYFCIFDLYKYKNKSDFIKNKFKRILIPYFVFGFFYVAPIMILFNFSNLSYIEYISRGIIIPLQSRHLWLLHSQALRAYKDTQFLKFYQALCLIASQMRLLFYPHCYLQILQLL